MNKNNSNTVSRQKAAQKLHRTSLLDRFLTISTAPASQYAHVKCSSSPFTAGFFQG